MAGIYIHIPFCRQKCYYCDFYKTVNTTRVGEFVAALRKETALRKNYLGNEKVNTVYFGGGTPSVLTPQQFGEILEKIKTEMTVDFQAEITVEANPDDLSPVFLEELARLGINRLSIGVQSLNNELLKKMNRRHNAKQAVEAVEMVAKAGFDNISVDLIYGLPGLTNQKWKEDLHKVFQLPVVHLSAYHLTYHEGTAFYTWLRKGTLKETSEKESIRQFETLIDTAGQKGFEHYEISNFARNGCYSKHNTSYWMGIPYLGLGPSAHSFNGNSRRWNVANTEMYIASIENGNSFWEEETLTETDKYNEYVLTRIRTTWGIQVTELENRFGKEKSDYFLKNIEKYLHSGWAVCENGTCKLTRKGLFVSDEIMADLMFI